MDLLGLIGGIVAILVSVGLLIWYLTQARSLVRKTDFEILRTTVRDQAEEIAGLKAELRAAEQRIDELEDENRTLKARVGELEEENQDLKAELVKRKRGA